MEDVRAKPTTDEQLEDLIKADKKKAIIIEFGELFLKQLTGRLNHFKEMIENEIDQVIQQAEPVKQSHDTRHAKPNVNQNVPNIRNTNKGLLKNR